jgi:ribosomal protein S18 acetylase RimI-like enzyme
VFGRSLQSAAEAFVIARGGERLLLEASSTPAYAAARAFYERAGYAVVGRVTDFYRPGDDCLMYCKAFDQSARASRQS